MYFYESLHCINDTNFNANTILDCLIKSELSINLQSLFFLVIKILFGHNSFYRQILCVFMLFHDDFDVFQHTHNFAYLFVNLSIFIVLNNIFDVVLILPLLFKSFESNVSLFTIDYCQLLFNVYFLLIFNILYLDHNAHRQLNLMLNNVSLSASCNIIKIRKIIFEDVNLLIFLLIFFSSC